MRGSVLPVAWYRLRGTWRHRRGGYLSIALMVGLVGGLGLGAVAGARRTQSSFPRYLAASNPSQLNVVTGVLNPLVGAAYNTALVQRISRLPHVKAVHSEVGLNVMLLNADGSLRTFPGFPPEAGEGVGSVDGEEITQDRATPVQGRLPDPGRADEVLMNQQSAQILHAHVGQRFLIGIYTNAQTELPTFGTPAVKPYRKVTITLAGIVDIPRNLVQDDIDAENSGYLAVFTPAFTRPLISCCANYSISYLQVSGGAEQVRAVQAGLRTVMPAGFPPPTVLADTVAKAERAVKPESIALGVFGGIAALAALLIAAQLVSRQLRVTADERAVLRAVGANPATTLGSDLLGLVGAVVAGTVLSIGVAVGLSPLAPLGPVRAVGAGGGLSFDWTVLGGGGALLMLALLVMTVVLARRGAPHRVHRPLTPSRATSAVARAASVGMPAPAVTGIRFALEPRAGRDPVPVRSAIVGAALAVMAVVGTTVFGSSLRTLVTHPALYGWNWDYMLSAGSGGGNIPEAQGTRMLNADRYVAAWAGAYVANGTLDGLQVAALAEDPGASIQPPILSGHGLDEANQIVLGPVTLSQLHKHVGDTVVVSNALTRSSTRLVIVGTATLPTLGGSGPHLEMGTGALISATLLPPLAKNPFNDPITGPQDIFVNLRPGADRAAALRSLQQIAQATTNNANFGVAVSPILRPAEIVNYRSLGTTPAVLGGALAAGAVAALSLTLVASVRRRRREMAVLRTLGFTGRQLAATVAWQSSVAVIIGTVVGIPVGIAVGRTLWKVFAEEIHAVPTPTVPAMWMVLIAVAALVLANLVAAVPARIASRTPTVLFLRAE